MIESVNRPDSFGFKTPAFAVNSLDHTRVTSHAICEKIVDERQRGKNQELAIENKGCGSEVLFSFTTNVPPLPQPS